MTPESISTIKNPKGIYAHNKKDRREGKIQIFRFFVKFLRTTNSTSSKWHKCK